MQFNVLGNHWWVVFEANKTVKSLDDAIAYCADNGGELATPRDPTKFRVAVNGIKRLAKNDNKTFLLIGMKDLNNDPTELTYLNG